MKKYISIFLLTLIIAGSSCKKNFLSLETNPNTPSVSSPELQLAGALKTTAAILNGTGYTMYAGWDGYLAWATGYQPNTAFEQYIITSSTYDQWSNYYANLSNYNALIGSNPGPNYVAIGKIMTAFQYEALVDNYNNVPYSQALQGTNNLTPAYDKGSDIYDDLMKQLDAAIALIKTTTDLTKNAPLSGSTAIVPGTGDIMYKGNMVNWLKFANTLKLRLALRQSNLTTKTAALQAAVAATSSLGYIDATNPAVVNPGYLNVDASGGQQSPLILAYGLNSTGGALGNNATYQGGSYSAHFYGTNNDPRLIQVFSISTTKNASHATAVQNATIDTLAGVVGSAVVASFFGADSPPTGIIAPSTSRANISPSKFGPGVLKSQTMNANILSSAEALFLQAEAAARGYITGTPATLYNAGIAASFADDLVPNAATAATTYAAQPAIAYPTGGALETQVQAIITQKWAALNLYGAFEAFNEMRRTGYPAVPTSIYPNANAPNQVKRIPYPFVEFSTNAANVAKEGTIGIFTSPIFWAK